jgi:hypothetical protein
MVVSQVDEQQIAVIPFAKHPTRQPNRLPDMAGTELGTKV